MTGRDTSIHNVQGVQTLLNNSELTSSTQQSYFYTRLTSEINFDKVLPKRISKDLIISRGHHYC